MNAPTIIAALIVLVVFAAIVGKGIYNRRHGKGGRSRIHISEPTRLTWSWVGGGGV